MPKNREIYEFTPVQYAEDEPNSNVIVTHFDYHSIDRNLYKGVFFYCKKLLCFHLSPEYAFPDT